MISEDDDDDLSVANFLLPLGGVTTGVQGGGAVEPLRGNGHASQRNLISEEEEKNKNGVQFFSEFASLLHLPLSLARRKLLICNSGYIFGESQNESGHYYLYYCQISSATCPPRNSPALKISQCARADTRRLAQKQEKRGS